MNFSWVIRITGVEECDARDDANGSIAGNINNIRYIAHRTEERMEYNFRDIEKRWQQWWKDNGVYKVSNPSTISGQAPKPKYYVLYT